MRSANRVRNKRLVITNFRWATHGGFVKFSKVVAGFDSQLLFWWERFDNWRVFFWGSIFQTSICSSKNVATTGIEDGITFSNQLCLLFIFVRPQRNRGGVIFSLQFVCVSVCLSVCVSDVFLWTKFKPNG